MQKSKFNSIVDKLLEGDLYNTSRKLTEEELKFLKQNPMLLQKISDTSFIKRKYIYGLFTISIMMMMAAKFFEYTGVLTAYRIVNNLLTEVLFAISMEMLGATIIAWFMEITLEKRMQKNKLLIDEINREKNQEPI